LPILRAMRTFDPGSRPLRSLTHSTLRVGARTLADRDRDLQRIFSRLGEPPLWGRRPGFASLTRIVLEQQVSLASARSVFLRLGRRLGGMTAERVAEAGEAALLEAGLTRQKARYCHGLAMRVADGSLDLSAVAALPDDDGRSILLSVPGLGPWSVDIYYLMALRRPDVWPEGDLALASALREVKGMDRLPTREEQRAIAAAWSPWRSVAARMLWAHYLSARGSYPTRPE
jgi:DNA-3-methyladenine glycosylase II